MAAIKDIKYIATSALYRLGKNPVGRELNWMVQVAIDYFSERSPMDGFVSLRTKRFGVANDARVFTLPSDCVRVVKVGIKSGRRIWTLTPDTSLTFPENFFECDADSEDPVINDGYYPAGYFGYFAGYTPFTLGGGGNVNYYRIDGRNIVFDHNIPDGEGIIEYLSNGGDISESTMIEVAYAEPFRLYLMSEYCLHKGSREDRQKYAILRNEYEAAQWNSNTIFKSERLSEMIDGRAQSTEFNL